MNKQGLFAYDKFSVKKDRSDRFVRNTDGTPVLNERLSSSVMLTPQDAKFLNSKWDQFQVYYKEVGVKIEPVKEKEPEVKVVAKIDIPQPVNIMELKKGLTLEGLKEQSAQVTDSVLSIMSKKELFSLLSIVPDKKQTQLTRNAELIEQIKQKLTN